MGGKSKKHVSGLTQPVTSFAELHKALEPFDPNSHIFRGVTSVSYQLVPSLGRMEFYRKDKSLKEQERLMFDKFRQRAVPYLTFTPLDLWDWLALAQHHGLPTRLLDWTLNPLVAAYFAVEDDTYNGDSLIYVVRGVREANVQQFQNPADVDNVFRYTPRHVTPRLVAQAGLFTVHPGPDEPLAEDGSVRRIPAFQDAERICTIPIRGAARRSLKKTLYWYGIHRAALFPGLDGLSHHIRWLREDTSKGRP